MSSLNLHHLRYFYEVARAGNINQASRQLGVSQPGLSKQIQTLEAELDLVLFFRTSKGIKLTPQGALVFERCQRIFPQLDDLERCVEEIRTGSIGRFRVGTVNSIGIHVLPFYLKRFRDLTPSVKVTVVYKRAIDVEKMLDDNEIDVAVVASETEHPGFERRLFQRDAFVFIAPPEHRLAGAPTFPASVLGGEAFIAFDPETPSHDIIARFLDKKGVRVDVVMESENIETIKKMVEIGVGVAAVPSETVRLELASGALVALNIDTEGLARDLVVLHPNFNMLPKAIRAFIELFPEV